MTPKQSQGAGSALITAGLLLVGFALVFAAAAATSPVDAATVSLAACGALLVYALFRIYALVRALARPEVLQQAGRGVGHFSRAELRDEKQRLLRAIKELEFDHGMGKLSKQDFDSVIETYRLRAIEVMRALEGEGQLHPELQRLLAERESAGQAQAASSPAARPPEPLRPSEQPPVPSSGRSLVRDESLDRTSRICVACSGHNDSDASFCKHCGVGLSSKVAGRELRGGSLASGEIP